MMPARRRLAGSSGGRRDGSNGDRSTERARPVGDQLGHRLAGRRRVQNAPDAVPGRDIGVHEARHPADQRQPVASDRAEAGLCRKHLGRGEHRRNIRADRMQAFDRARIGCHLGRVDRQRALARNRADIGCAVRAREQLRALPPRRTLRGIRERRLRPGSPVRCRKRGCAP